MREVFRQLPVSLNIPQVRRTPNQALNSVTSKTGKGVYASADRLFKGAIFGRDSLEVADDLMYANPRLVRKILLTISSLNGESDNPENEEEPGKVIHEYRTPVVDGKPLNSTSQEIYERLSDMWGGDENSLAYYGSVDATPHYIKTLSNYCHAYGDEILTEQVNLRSGKRESVLVIMENAIQWLTTHLDNSESGFVEYKRRNPKGIENQVWKDSREFYVHRSGELANHDKPISSIEVQSLAYDALKSVAEILPSHKERLTKYATQLGKLVFELLWMPEVEYFALGTDFDQDGKLRVIETTTANPAELLDSEILKSVSADDRQKYISGIVREIMGTSFLTDAGIRSRGLNEANVVKNWDYHGSYVTWPKETYDIAKGLRRQGLPLLADQLENRLINVVRAARSYPEFFYVDERGRILDVPTKTRYHGNIIEIDSTNKPEKIQAWTVAAIVSINTRRRRKESYERQLPENKWLADLQNEVMRHIPHIPTAKSASELKILYPFYPYKLNHQN